MLCPLFSSPSGATALSQCHLLTFFFLLHFHALLLVILMFNITLKHGAEVLVRVSKSKKGVFKQKHI